MTPDELKQLEQMKFDEIEGIENYLCVLGLSFPESASDFQKSALTLAHLMASVRDYVLKGIEVPGMLIQTIYNLSFIVFSNGLKQR